VKVEDLTALHVASHGGFQPIVTILLDAGAKSEIGDNEGRTSVHYAVAGYTQFKNCSVQLLHKLITVKAL